MAINMSSLLTRIKKELGIHGLMLPLESDDKDLVETIKDITLPTFSNFFPEPQRVSFDLKDLECLQSLYQESVYVVPSVFGNREILSVRKVNPRSLLLSGGYYAPYIDSTPELYYGMLMGQANADLVSAAAPPFTFKFIAPNRLHLYNITTMYGILDIDFNLSHAENLSSIKKSMYDTFYKLAIIDIKIFLYGMLKHYKNIQTAYGTINLEVDDWANAPSEREDLLERWRDTWHLDQEQFYVI